jgi:hypothetical protein
MKTFKEFLEEAGNYIKRSADELNKHWKDHKEAHEAIPHQTDVKHHPVEPLSNKATSTSFAPDKHLSAVHEHLVKHGYTKTKEREVKNGTVIHEYSHSSGGSAKIEHRTKAHQIMTETTSSSPSSKDQRKDHMSKE